MKVENMIGYKIFKSENDELIIYRIIDVHHVNKELFIKVKNLDTDEEKDVKMDELEGYTPLQPDAYITFNIVYIMNEGKKLEDIIITASKVLNLKIGDTTPFAICRQSITDIFYNMMAKNENDIIVGLSINQEDCPSNFDFRNFLACDGIDYSENVYYYRTDTIKDILPMININKYNKIMRKNFTDHLKATKNTNALFKKEDRGWCVDIETLIKENNFQSDIDQMLGITAVDFDISKCIEEKILPGTDDKTYESVTDSFKFWLSKLHRININTISIVEFGYDIDLVDFKNSRYFLLRDNTGKLYLLVYTIDRDELEFDLVNKYNKASDIDKYVLDFYNKYNKYNN